MLSCIILYLCKLIDGITFLTGEYGLPQPWNFMVTKAYWCSYDYSADKNLEDADSVCDPSRMQESRCYVTVSQCIYPAEPCAVYSC